MQRSLYFFLLVFLLPGSVLAQSFVVSDIRLEGLQRIAASNIFGLLNVNVGDEVTDAQVANIVKDVFASDSFEDVEVLREDSVLIIRVQERPSISEITIDGNKLIPTEALLENMEDAGLAVGQVYKPSTMEGMQIALEGQYVAQGMYGASVNVNIKVEERNRVAILININEGDSSKIVHINIVGNTVFEEKELLDLFELKPSHLTSIIKKDDRYAREKINGDLERLTSYYMDQGYINFVISSTQVSVTPNKEEVYITINISEGELYVVNEIELAGDLVNLEYLLRLVMQTGPGQIFSQQLVTSSAEFMTQILGSRGYFFAEVEGVPLINEEEKTVDVTFFVNAGDRTYVNRINFYGNTNTVDEVLRREMRQMEGAPASSVALEQSKVRLERLGYFSTVEFETSEIAGTSDQIDVDFSVQEQPSGTIGGSIGYAQVQGLVLSANLQQSNFLGTGKQVGIGVSTSAFSTNYNFSFRDPYYTIDGVSRGFSLSYTKSDYAELNLAAYSTNQFGMNVNFGYPIGETQRLNFGFGYTNTEIEVGFGPVQEIKASPVLLPNITTYMVDAPRYTEFTDPETGEVFPISDGVIAPYTDLPTTAFNTRQGFIDREGSRFNDYTVTISWSNVKLNLGLFPTSGSSQSLSLEIAVPGSDLPFYRIRYDAELYLPVYREFRLHFRTALGYGDGYAGTEQLPFFRNFYAGGLGTVRGFERNTLGPRSTAPAIYEITKTEFYKDDDGNIILDDSGKPGINPAGPSSYLLIQARDDGGSLIYDDTGQPVYEEIINSSALYFSIPDPFGGNIQATGTMELLFPLPFIKDRSRLRSAFFVDVGNVFSSYCSIREEKFNNCDRFKVDRFRYSAGVSVSWFSGAFGTMTFSLAQPFNTTVFDEVETFQFTIGNTF